jgi:hypothetical protein
MRIGNRLHARTIPSDGLIAWRQIVRNEPLVRWQCSPRYGGNFSDPHGRRHKPNSEKSACPIHRLAPTWPLPWQAGMPVKIGGAVVVGRAGTANSAARRRISANAAIARANSSCMVNLRCMSTARTAAARLVRSRRRRFITQAWCSPRPQKRSRARRGTTPWEQ